MRSQGRASPYLGRSSPSTLSSIRQSVFQSRLFCRHYPRVWIIVPKDSQFHDLRRYSSSTLSQTHQSFNHAFLSIANPRARAIIYVLHARTRISMFSTPSSSLGTLTSSSVLQARKFLSITTRKFERLFMSPWIQWPTMAWSPTPAYLWGCSKPFLHASFTCQHASYVA